MNAINDLGDLFTFEWICGHLPLTPTTLQFDDNYEEQVLERLHIAQKKKDYIDDNDDTRKKYN